MGPKRIAYVDHALQLGGAQKSLLELVARLDRRRFSPVLLCAEGAEWLDRPELEGVEQVPVFEASPLLEQRRDQLHPSVLRSRGQLLGGLTPVLRLRRALRAVKADLVHTNTLKAHFLGGAAGRLSGLPVLWHVRDILDPGPARTWLLRASKLLRPQVIAISQAVAAQFASQNVPVELIYNGIPLDHFTPGQPDPSLRRELQLSPEDEVLTIVGRLTPWKGHRTLLEALAILSAQRPQVRLLVVGEVAFWEASYGEELEHLAEDLGIADRVSWLGFREDVPQ
ncbi:glycosyltransferase, partial [bacterium]|nr:glycosyltransferase [bacterium]